MTFNTGNPIGSTDARDRSDNSENLDLAVNSLSQTFVDRLGVTRDTLEGIYQKSAYYRAGTFEAGYTLTNNRQTLAYGNVEYSWSGAFPKVVAAGSTPATTGGIGVGAWVDRTQEILRSELSSVDGERLIGQLDSVSSLRLLSPAVGQRIKIKKAVGVISGDFYCSSNTTATDDGYNTIAAANGYRWRRINILNTDDLGCVYDGVTDDSAKINAALAAGCSVELLGGRGAIALASELFMSVDKTFLYSRSNVTAIKTAAHNGINIKANDCIVDCGYLHINGNSKSGSGNLVTGARNKVCGVVSYSNGDHGFCVDGQSTTATFNEHENCFAYGNGQVGFAVNSAPDYTRRNCRSYNNQYEGLTIDLTSYRARVIGYRSFQDCQSGGVGGIGIDQASQSQLDDIHVQDTKSSLPAIKFQNNIASSNYCALSNITLLDNAGGGLHFYKNTATGFTANYNVVNGLTCQNNTGFDIKIDDGCIGNVLSGIAQNAVIIDVNTTPKNTLQGGVRSAFRAYNNTLRSNVTGDGTTYTIPFDAENFDANSEHSSGVFTVQKTGMYQLNAGIRLQGGSGGTYARLNILQQRSGSAIQTSAGEFDSAAIGTFQPQVSDVFYLVRGDTVSCSVVVGGGTKTYSIPAESGLCYFSGSFIN